MSTGQVLQETKATSIYFPAGLHLRLRTKSLHEGRSMNQILISAAELYLKQGEKQP
jgi:predicted DNA-binding protein